MDGKEAIRPAVQCRLRGKLQQETRRLLRAVHHGSKEGRPLLHLQGGGSPWVGGRSQQPHQGLHVVGYCRNMEGPIFIRAVLCRIPKRCCCCHVASGTVRNWHAGARLPPPRLEGAGGGAAGRSDGSRAGGRHCLHPRAEQGPRACRRGHFAEPQACGVGSRGLLSGTMWVDAASAGAAAPTAAALEATL